MIHTNSGTASNERLSVFFCDLSFTDSNVDSSEEQLMSVLEIPDTLAFRVHCVLLSKRRISGTDIMNVDELLIAQLHSMMGCCLDGETLYLKTLLSKMIFIS